MLSVFPRMQAGADPHRVLSAGPLRGQSDSSQALKAKVGLDREESEGIPGQNCTNKEKEVGMSRPTTSFVFRGNYGI